MVRIIKDRVIVGLTDDGERIVISGENLTIQDIKGIREIRGRRKPSVKYPHWTLSKDLRSARELRKVLGVRMKLAPNLLEWAHEAREEERNIRRLQSATDAKLEHTPQRLLDAIEGKPIKAKLLPPRHPLTKPRKPRPYQRADAKMMAMSNVINANQVGTGKTLEAIAAIHEAQLQDRPVLIIAPKLVLETVWMREYVLWTNRTFLTSADPLRRKEAIQLATARKGWVGALGIIADDIRLVKYHSAKSNEPMAPHELHACRDHKGNYYRYKDQTQQRLFEIDWGVVIVDEFHRTGANSRDSLMHISIKQLRQERLWFISGTPTGGKPRRLWAILHLMYPKLYTSEWAWINEWLEVEVNEYYTRGGRRHESKEVGDIMPARADEFYNHHRAHIVRRLRKDALPGIPDAVHIMVPTPMTKPQGKIYQKFDLESEVSVNGKRISAAGVLAVYTRLRQLSSLAPGGQTGKIEPLLEALDENGIRVNLPEPGARAYIGCLTHEMVDYFSAVLLNQGITTLTLTGKSKSGREIIERFHSDDPNPLVLIMTIQTGGSGIDLQPANSAHLLEESWDPDETEQFFGRGDRGSRDTPLRCYTYRTPHTIQDYVAQVAYGKQITNRTIMKYAESIERLRGK